MAMPSSLQSRNWFSQVIPLVDKFAPDKSAALKQRQAEVQKSIRRTSAACSKAWTFSTRT